MFKYSNLICSGSVVDKISLYADSILPHLHEEAKIVMGPLLAPLKILPFWLKTVVFCFILFFLSHWNRLRNSNSILFFPPGSYIMICIFKDYCSEKSHSVWNFRGFRDHIDLFCWLRTDIAKAVTCLWSPVHSGITILECSLPHSGAALV